MEQSSQDQHLYTSLYSGRVRALQDLLTALADGELPLLARIDWGVYGLPGRRQSGDLSLVQINSDTVL